MSDALEVWLDVDFLSDAVEVGTLSHDRGTIRFSYAPSWLHHPLRFALDPDLSLGEGTYYPNAEQGNFRIFDDSAPDRWGQMLMRRREALAAIDEERPPRALYAWDFLLGVQDLTRQGALRLRRPGGESFLSNEPLPAPPVTSLRELEAVAAEITARRLDDLDALRRWLAVLVAPGASLGGARPKANFADRDGSLWIAKFPARDDGRDIGAWEALVHDLARDTGIDVPDAELRTFGSDYRTFCVRRFDRIAGKRRFYASAMAMLRKSESEGTSYLEIAEFLQHHGAKNHISRDLEQLFRRVAFNVAVGNRDDHLRNHGFILTASGWRLAPAFDVNPSIDKADHVLNLDETENRPSLTTVIASGEWYVGSKDRAARIVDEVVEVIRSWRQRAAKLNIARVDIETTAAAFAVADSWRRIR
jgi:serine/threonine-protein kinase HipA